MTSTPLPTEAEHWCSAVGKKLEDLLQARGLSDDPSHETIAEAYGRTGWVRVVRTSDLRELMKPMDWVLYDMVRLLGRFGRRCATTAYNAYLRQGCEMDQLPVWLRYTQHDVEVDFHVQHAHPVTRINVRMHVGHHDLVR